MRRVPLAPALLDEIQALEGRLVPYAECSPGSFSRTVRRWTGITRFHVHRCRHTFACRWLEGGGNLAVLQQILGHRDLSTTMRYAKVTDELLERESERVARRLEELRVDRNALYVVGAGAWELGGDRARSVTFRLVVDVEGARSGIAAGSGCGAQP